MKDHAVIVFTRIPLPGRTKTRLQPYLSGEECLRLHQAFLRDISSTLELSTTPCDKLVCYEPTGNPATLAELLPNAHTFFPQRGNGLGEKMHNAVCDALGLGYRRCLLMGSDLPLLQPKAIDDGFQLLESRDIVLCPTEDGGYYLIGMKAPCPQMFCLTYGVSTVFEHTLRAAALAGKTCAIGPPALDVDDQAGLFALTDRLAQAHSASTGIETRKALRYFFRDGGGHEHHRPKAYSKI